MCLTVARIGGSWREAEGNQVCVQRPVRVAFGPHYPSLYWCNFDTATVSRNLAPQVDNVLILDARKLGHMSDLL